VGTESLGFHNSERREALPGILQGEISRIETNSAQLKMAINFVSPLECPGQEAN
jgi:hypothetical protein